MLSPYCFVACAWLSSPAALDIAVTGGEELVWDYDRDSVEKYNLCDFHPVAYKTADSQTHLSITHYKNYRISGSSLSSLYSTPQRTFDSDAINSQTFGDFGYHQWIASPYTEDGTTFYALAHSEWYACLQYGSDPVRGCDVGSNQINSWVNAITLFTSTDGGGSWMPAGGNNANHVVIAPSMPYPDGWHFWEQQLHYGFFHPSNIVKENSFYYATVDGAYRDPATAKVKDCGTALMRTSSLADAKSWKFWSGSDWVVPASWDSVPFLPGKNCLSNFGSAMSTITFSRTANLWVLMWDMISELQFATTLSLASPQLAPLQPLKGSAGFQRPGSYVPGYDILQDTSTSTFNFASVGDAAYLYRCKNNDDGLGGVSRSIVRYAVTLSGGGPSPSPAPATLSPIFRCVVAGKHTVSQSSSCDGGLNEGELGCLATAAIGDSSPLYVCQNGDDQLQTVLSGCEGLPLVGSLGWIWSSSSSLANRPLYRCIHTGFVDHFLSLDSECEGQTIEGLLGYAASCASDVVI